MADADQRHHRPRGTEVRERELPDTVTAVHTKSGADV